MTEHPHIAGTIGPAPAKNEAIPGVHFTHPKEIRVGAILDPPTVVLALDKDTHIPMTPGNAVDLAMALIEGAIKLDPALVAEAEAILAEDRKQTKGGLYLP